MSESPSENQRFNRMRSMLDGVRGRVEASGFGEVASLFDALITETWEAANGRGARWRRQCEESLRNAHAGIGSLAVEYRSLRASQGEIQAALGLVEERLGELEGASEGTWRLGEVHTDAGSGGAKGYGFVAPVMQGGVRVDATCCEDTEPHDPHGVLTGENGQGFWCPGVPLVEEEVEEAEDGPVDEAMFPPGYQASFEPGHAERVATHWKRRFLALEATLTGRDTEEADDDEGYARLKVSSPMPPAEDGRWYTGVASLTTDKGQTFVTAEYAASMIRETERHNEELRSALSETRIANELLLRQAARDLEELEHLRDFKRVAHEALDEAGVAPYPDAECRIVARIEALSRVTWEADQQATANMRRERERDQEMDVPGAKRVRMYRHGVVVRELVVAPGALFNVEFDGGEPGFDRLEYTDA